MYSNACKLGTSSPFTFQDYYLSDPSISISATNLNEAISNEMPYVHVPIEFRELDTGELHKLCFWYYIRLCFCNLVWCLHAVLTTDSLSFQLAYISFHRHTLTNVLHIYRPQYVAEKALATLNGHAIKGILPPIYLNLSPTSPSQPQPLRCPSVTPCLVRQLPPGFTDVQLYEIFRPYSSIGSAHMQVQNQNESGVIEFWNEDNAKVAEEVMHCAEVDGYNIAVQVCHPPPVNLHTPWRARSEGFNAMAQPFVPSRSIVGGFSAPSVSFNLIYPPILF